MVQGKQAVLTGGTAGLGCGLLHECVRLCASKVFLVCRSLTRGEAARAAHAAQVATEIVLIRADLSSMADVSDAAAKIRSAAGDGIDFVFLNAATMPGGSSRTTAEGLEEGLAVNVCSLHLLSRLLVPALSMGARFIVTGSDAGGIIKYKVDLEKVNGASSGYFAQYCRTKALTHMLAAALSDRLDVAGIDAHVCVFHPGAVDSQMGNQLAPMLAAVVKPILRLFFRSPLRASAFAVHAATCTAPLHREFLAHGNFGRPTDMKGKPIPGGEDAGVCEAAWQAIEALVCTALKVESLGPIGGGGGSK
jgi:NAD(P)-dependent dehydrogenase (short-subunit alcohol dehydrogenase family)